MLSTELCIISAFQYFIACYVFSTCVCYIMDQKFIPSTSVWLQNTIMHEISETLFFLTENYWIYSYKSIHKS